MPLENDADPHYLERLREKARDYQLDLITKYVENIRQFLTPNQLTFAEVSDVRKNFSHIEQVILDFFPEKSTHKACTSSESGPETIGSRNAAQLHLDSIPSRCKPALSGNWMSFDEERVIQNWHVGHQGAVPSCNGWAVADGVLTFLLNKFEYERKANSNEQAPRYVRLGNNNRFTVDRDRLPSVRHIWMLGKLNLNAPLLDSAWEFINDGSNSRLFQTVRNFITAKKIVLREEMPYHYTNPFGVIFLSNSDRRVSSASDNFSASDSRKLHAYELWSSSNSETTFLTLLKDWLTNVGPVAWEFDPPEDLYGAVQNSWNDPNVAELDMSYSETGAMVHSVAIVGYFQSDGRQYLIARNSYGIDWGYYGQFYFEWNSFSHQRTKHFIGIDIVPNQ